MTSFTFEIREFDPRTSGESDFRRLTEFRNALNSESWPEDPPTSVEEIVQQLRTQPSFLRNPIWAVKHPGAEEILATATVWVLHTGENQHAADFMISVRPEVRRRGIAKALLRPVARVAREEGRRLLMTSTTSAVPAGDAFMQRLGAEMAIANYRNQLEIAEVNHDAVRSWLARAVPLEAEFELGLWQGPYPESDLEAIAKLHSVMNMRHGATSNWRTAIPPSKSYVRWRPP